jgi:hypothetical protein
VIVTKLGYSIAGAVFATDWTRTFVYQNISNGKLVAKKAGRRTIITAESLHKLMDELPTAKIRKTSV